MEEPRTGKTTRRAFISKRSLHLFLLGIGAALCLSFMVIHNHPAPSDTRFAEKMTENESALTSHEHLFAVMDQDASAIELTVHDYNVAKGEPESYNIYISSGTVADALEKAGIVLNEFDEISIDDNTQIHNGMELTITRVTVEQELEYGPLPFEVVRQESSNLPINVEKVIQEGVDGERCYTYDIIYKNGEVADKVPAGSTVSKKAVNKIICYGTASYYRPDSNYTISEEDKTITLSDGIVLHYTDTIDVLATAYTTQGHKNKITKSGSIARYGIIAVDPRVIPLGTHMYVVAEDGSWTYGYAVAGDTGGKIKRKHVDLFYDTTRECIIFGTQDATIYILSADEQ